MILMIRARARAFKFFSKKKTANRARAESNRNALFRTNRTERPRRRRRRTLPHARVVVVVHRVVHRDARRPKRPAHFFDRSPNRSEPTRPVRWDERARRHERDTPDDPVARAFALAFAHASVRPSVRRAHPSSVRPSVRRARRETEPSSVRWFKIRVVRLPSSSSLPSSVVPGMRRMPNRESGLSNPPRASLPSSSSVVRRVVVVVVVARTRTASY